MTSENLTKKLRSQRHYMVKRHGRQAPLRFADTLESAVRWMDRDDASSMFDVYRVEAQKDRWDIPESNHYGVYDRISRTWVSKSSQNPRKRNMTMNDHVTVEETYKTGKGYGVIVSESGKMRGPYIITAVVGDGGPKRSKAQKLLEARAKLRRKLGPLRKAANPGEVVQVCNPRPKKPSARLRDMERPEVLGYELDRETLTPKHSRVDTSAPGDYGADPLGDGTFRMVPSGDIVDWDERNRRLGKRNPRQRHSSGGRSYAIEDADGRQYKNMSRNEVIDLAQEEAAKYGRSIPVYLVGYMGIERDTQPVAFVDERGHWQPYSGKANPSNTSSASNPLPRGLSDLYETALNLGRELGAAHRNKGKRLPTRPGLDKMAKDATARAKRRAAKGVHIMPVDRAIVEAKFKVGFKEGFEGERNPSDDIEWSGRPFYKSETTQGRFVTSLRQSPGAEIYFVETQDILRGRKPPSLPQVYREVSRDAAEKEFNRHLHEVKKLITRDTESERQIQRGMRKRNPSSASMDAADSLYESFHGKAPTRTTRVITKVKARTDFAELGPLVELKVHLLNGRKWVGKFPVDGRDSVTLASSPDGRQLYFIGGNQALDLRELGMDGSDWERDSMVLGVLEMVTYRTEKGFDNFQLTDYYHELGEESGMQPLLMYDNLNQLLSVAGGQYEVRPEGIVN